MQYTLTICKNLEIKTVNLTIDKEKCNNNCKIEQLITGNAEINKGA